MKSKERYKKIEVTKIGDADIAVEITRFGPDGRYKTYYPKAHSQIRIENLMANWDISDIELGYNYLSVAVTFLPNYD